MDIAFHAGTNQGPQYKVTGRGVYRVGGEVAYLQDAFLDIQVDNGFTTTKALCANTDRSVRQQWPKVQFNIDQTNGTPGQVFHLNLVAVPIPQVHFSTPDLHLGTVQLQWQGYGTTVQVERALSLDGPFSAVTSITTNSSFTDTGVLTNHSLVFYRLRLY